MNKAEPTIMIRPARQDDLDALVFLLEKLFGMEEDFVFNEELQRKGLQLMLANELGCLLVAEADGEVVGMCSGQLTVSTAEGGPSMLIEDLVVREDFRRRGTGGRLMARLAEWGKGKGVSRFQLLADRSNTAALDFYARLGWKTTNLICLRKIQ